MNAHCPGSRVLVTGFHPLARQQGTVQAVGDKAYTVDFGLDGVHDIPADQLLPVRTPARHAHSVAVTQFGDNGPGHRFQTYRATVSAPLAARATARTDLASVRVMTDAEAAELGTTCDRRDRTTFAQTN